MLRGSRQLLSWLHISTFQSRNHHRPSSVSTFWWIKARVVSAAELSFGSTASFQALFPPQLKLWCKLWSFGYWWNVHRCARLMLLHQLRKHTPRHRANKKEEKSSAVDVCPLIFPLQSCFGRSSITSSAFVDGRLLLFLFSVSALTGRPHTPQ